jgi:predicted dehydrogenase
MQSLAGICEPSPDHQRFLKETYPHIPVYEQLDEALAQCKSDAVVIATTAATHAEIARKCLLAGRHALVEKPMALSMQDAEEIVYLAQAHDRVLAVGHLLMYHPGLLKLNALIDSGELGDILSVQCTRTNLGKIRNEENAWWSLAPHDLSILSLLLREKYSLTNAAGHQLLGRPELPDTVTALFRSESGRQGSIHVSWLAPEKKHETIVIGTQKIAIFDDAQPVERKLGVLDYTLDRQGRMIQGIQRGAMAYISYETPNELLFLEAQAFLAAVRGEINHLPNDGANGLEVVKQLTEVQAMLDQHTSAPILL